VIADNHAQQIRDRDQLVQTALLGGADQVAMDPRLSGATGSVRTRAVVSAALGYLIGVGAIRVTPADELDEWMPLGIPEHLRPDIEAMIDGNRAVRDAPFLPKER
jgi:hypothetical protein